jgi:glyoxylase I family protein
MINGVHHVAVSTADIEATIKFYTEGLGAELVMEFSWENNDTIDGIVGLKSSAAKQAMLRLGNTHIEVFEYISPKPKPADPERTAANHGYTHFCLDVTDIESEVKRLEKYGMKFFAKEPLKETGGIRAIYGRDPNGNIIELQEVFPNCEFPIALEQVKK